MKLIGASRHKLWLFLIKYDDEWQIIFVKEASPLISEIMGSFADGVI